MGAVHDARGQLRDQVLDNVCVDSFVTTGVALQAFGNDILGPRVSSESRTSIYITGDVIETTSLLDYQRAKDTSRW